MSNLAAEFMRLRREYDVPQVLFMASNRPPRNTPARTYEYRSARGSVAELWRSAANILAHGTAEELTTLRDALAAEGVIHCYTGDDSPDEFLYDLERIEKAADEYGTRLLDHDMVLTLVDGYTTAVSVLRSAGTLEIELAQSSLSGKV